METVHIKNKDWQNLLRDISEEEILFAPFEGVCGLEYKKVSATSLEDIVYPEIRLTQSVKLFIYPAQERLTSVPNPQKKTVILGVKACDLKALPVLDEIFLKGDFIDPFFKAWRDSTIFIASDCVPGKSCFCNLLGGKPFAESGFDLNVSQVDGAVLVDIGSEKGEQLLTKFNVSHEPAQEIQLKHRKEKREESVLKLKEVSKGFKFDENITKVLDKGYESVVWKEFAETCVGCCACTNICPSCNCFLLTDLTLDHSQEFEKMRTWDSCQSTGYARVAGGANPRKKLFERFRNRFYCKLKYKPEGFKLLACTGCGRCIEACQGKIDIREVLTKVAA